MKSTNEYILDGMRAHKTTLERKVENLIEKYSEGEISLGELTEELNLTNKTLVDLDLNISAWISTPKYDEIPF